ncbi:hypothetical protein HELRODRAFT_159230 [Helobdella robusta]|uniref:Uncharacterized protein n=1 Tax=Helobdella robusta TaxID=6412 RepID=T1ENS0_HELRO|nr:hypothetical protein HELRODRAFT_159230 [Helobdella robusta]ESO12654.1 hypothetical protein HELRODRAFT_159230 [Helobdella robusta]
MKTNAEEQMNVDDGCSTITPQFSATSDQAANDSNNNSMNVSMESCNSEPTDATAATANAANPIIPIDVDADDENFTALNKSQLLNLNGVKKEAEKLEQLKNKEMKERQKQEEKEKKEKEKNELKMRKEKEKEDKEREREEKRRQKLEQVEEKKKKEEAKLEGKRKKEEEKNKTEKEKQLMQNFFIKTTKKQTAISTKQPNDSVNPLFMPFELKSDMRLAPCTRYNRTNLTERKRSLEHFLTSRVISIEFFFLRDEDELIIITNASEGSAATVDDQMKPIMKKMKFLQFHDNYRPAYYGTWMKKSSSVSGRRPFAKDSKHLDYEVDSDEEWEEEEPGESIVNSEGEEETEDAEKVEEEGDDDEFFVPHGYLSEGEGCDEGDEDDFSPEALKQMQMLKAKNFEASMKCNKIEKLQPVFHGLFFWNPYYTSNSSNNKTPADKKYEDMAKFFKDFMAVPINYEFPIDLNEPASSSITSSPSEVPLTQDKSTSKKRIYAVPEEAIPFLIKLVHGCYWSSDKMTREFKHFWLTRNKLDASNSQIPEINDDDNFVISKRQLEAKIKEIATYKKDAKHSNRLWYVNDDILIKYQLQHLPIPSAWEWSNAPSSSRRHLSTNATPSQPQEVEPIMNKEARTPKMSMKINTPQSTGKISNFLVKRQSQQLSTSVRKNISPSYNAVMSDSTVKRRGSDSSRFPSESAFSPVDGAAQGVTSFENRKQNRIDADKTNAAVAVSNTPSTSKKRSSEVDLGPVSKRPNKSAHTFDEDSSEDCVIIDPAPCFVSLSPLKDLNSGPTSPKLVDTSKIESVSKATQKEEASKLNKLDIGRENQAVPLDSYTGKTSNLKNIASFFNLEPPAK